MIGQRSNKIDVNRFSFLGNIEMNGNDICVAIGFEIMTGLNCTSDPAADIHSTDTLELLRHTIN